MTAFRPPAAARPLDNSYYLPTLMLAVDELLARGVPPATLEAACKRPLEELRGALHGVPQLFARRFWTLARQLSGEPAIGLQLGCGQLSRRLNPLSYLFDVSPSLQRCCAHLVEVLPAFQGQFRFEASVEAEACRLRLLDCGRLRAPPAMIDFHLSGLCSLLRRKLLVLGQDLGPLRLAMGRPAPAHAERYAAAWGLAVDWQQPHYALHIPRSLYERELNPGDEPLSATLLALIAQQTGSAPPSLLQQVCDFIVAHLDQDPSLEAFSDRHFITPRTVTRRLLGQGWRYGELLDEHRRCRAEDLLREPALNQAEIAEQTGYRDASSFARAFVRWHACSPGAWRDAQSAHD
ncbi:AraC family transcriptional regulator ligand-binding domain-containing protein [Pseudomonas sp. UL073]|uniref:AraC family transcriptional regulator ligand-binding domain-containing protein n=1 Tax=Zestomonas insulae TaxID=2809017 RepID=A0ABS2IFK8_9GAMM|nr:AraC family transcriptional regulator [Pseudomonas insulae]MBM7061742.1 AraC family transcriptional regulator ligand-binding domain-containing protein [Pseudomonas insulae]